MRYVLILLGLMFVNVAQAMNCQELPDCESLGYSKGEDPNCVEDGYLNCPFDQDYKVCVQYNCEALGFTESDKTSWCADLIKCKGNEKMTLCQKACVATNAQELKELASSGKCKVVTMRNDIVLPEDMTLTLAENTTIDGGGYGLTFNISGTKSGLFAFHLTKNSGLENINVHYKQTGNAHKFDFVRGNGSLHNVRFDGDGAALSNNQYDILFSQSQVTVSGRFEVDFNNHGRSTRLSESSNIDFINAQVIIKRSGEHRNGFTRGTINFKDSEFTMDNGSNFLLMPTNVHFENTKFKYTGGTIFWTQSQNQIAYLNLNKNANVSFTLDQIGGNTVINLSGTPSEPARLEINTQNVSNAKIQATNLNDTLVLNGVSYHPTKEATTELSEIDGSDNWGRVQ